MFFRFATSPRTLLVIGVAIVMAFISAKVLFNGSVLNAVPWGILAFGTSFLASRKREAWTLGGIFGFVVSYAFLWFDNTDTKTVATILTLIALILLPALFGALCGLLAAWLGWTLRQSFRAHKS